MTTQIDSDIDEKTEEEIEKINATLLKGFKKRLKDNGLKDKSIKNHVSNIDFYINDYLRYSTPIEAKDGIGSVSSFLGDWFIRKATWSSKAEIKGNAASLKKFYSFLLENGEIEEDSFDDLKLTIKEEMPSWLDCVQEYDNAAY